MNDNSRMWIERMGLVTKARIAALNRTLVRKGFEAGERGDEEPGIGSSLSYWHGWRSGAVLSGRIEPDAVRFLVPYTCGGESI